MTKADLLLIAVLFLIGTAGMAAVNRIKKTQGSQVLITVDGGIYGTYSLSKDQTIPIKINGSTTNTLQISKGQARMIQADCPDQLCIHQHPVSGRGGTIVCLPNKIVAEVRGGDAEVDSISR